jgi:hypothetical protein
MPAEYLEDPADEFDYFTDWKESIENTQPGGGDHSSRRDQEACLTGWIPFNKVRSAEKWFLGYSWCDDGDPYQLHRRPPCRHPRKPHLYADSFSSIGIGPKSQSDNPNKETYVESPWKDPDDYSLYYADYQYALCTVRFKSYGRVLFLPDSEFADVSVLWENEWKRYTEIVAGPQTQALQADGSSNLNFLEGSPAGAPPYGQAFPAPLAELMAKCNVRVRWLQVPHEYLSANRFYLNPAKIISLLGHVSNESLMGFAAGTLLLLAAEFEPSTMPLTSDDPLYPLTAWDVILSFEQFDPPKGVADSPPGTSPYRGHRLFPWRVDGKWYYAVRENGTSELLPQADLTKVFQHVNDPS